MTAMRSYLFLGLPGVLLLGLILATTGCQTQGAPQPAADETPAAAQPATTDDTEVAFSEEEARMKVAEGERQAVAQRQFEIGMDFFRRARYEEAYDQFLKVLELDPYHAQAQAQLAETSHLLGYEEGGAALFDLEEREQVVAQQQLAMEIQARLDRGQAAYDEGDYDGAIEAFERALEILRFQHGYQDFSSMRAQAQDMLARSNKARDEALLTQERRIRDEAMRQKEQEERDRVERLDNRVRLLFDKGNTQFRKGNYLYAKKIFDEVLRLDPTNKDAARLQETAEDAYHTRKRGETLRNHIEEWRRTMEHHQQSEIFQNTIVDWPDRDEWLSNQALRQPRRPSGVEVGESAQDAAIRRRLSQTRVTLEFDETPLEEVRAYLQEISGVNIVIDPAVYDENPDAAVTINLTELPLDSALKLILDLQGLGSRVDNGVLIISTPETARGKPVLSLYNVQDLTGPLQDFPGPSIELSTEEDSGGGFGISLGTEETVATIGEDELVDLITQNVYPDSWDEEGHHIDVRNKTLIVAATPDVHAEVERMLNNLRQSGGILVTIESRFLTVEDNFLESLGIDWRGLGDQTVGGEVPAPGTLATFDDLLFNIPDRAELASNTMSAGRDGTPGLYYDDGADGDLRARVENLFDSALGDPNVLTRAGGLSLQYVILDDVELEFIIRAVRKTDRVTLLTAPKVTAFNTQRAHVTVVNQIAYVRDFDVEVAQRAAIADPIIGTIQDGIVLDVRPIVSSDRRYITMELRPTVAELIRPIDTFETSLATGSVFDIARIVSIQIPELTLQKVRTTVTVPDGGTVLIGGLRTSTIQNKESTLPFLRNVPGAKLLFARQGDYEHRRDLVILIRAAITSLADEEPRPRLTAPM